MKFLLPLLALVLAVQMPQARAASGSASNNTPITVTQGSVTIPTYEHVGRYMQPPLFSDSTLAGLYPFTTYKREWKKGSPQPKKYPAIFVESKYLKLTYIPELGGRFVMLYDKVRHREVFYRNDVIKPTQFNPRFSWPQLGIELTGPYDAHTLTIHNEPYWSHLVIRHKDGSVSVMLGELDPIYHMDVSYTATIYPDVDALKITTFCYNPNDGQKPQMLWSNASFPVTPKTRFLYPMTDTVGHTTGVVSPWPIYNGVDLSWAHNNMHMLGVFGIDSYDNYGGAYEFDNNYGVFRFADRRVVQGMKMWTFGFGPDSSAVMHGYTDNAGPYYEAQSGRMVWDGHYEWVYPHSVEQWHEWWIPVAGIDGLTTLQRDVALNLTVHADPAGQDSSVKVALSPVVPMNNVKLVVKANSGELLNTTVNFAPGTPIIKTAKGLHEDKAGLKNMEVKLTAPDGKVLMDYHRPDKAPGGDVTPFARGLLNPPIPPAKMTAQELVIAARFKQKDLNPEAAAKLAKMALKIDSGYSDAHRLLGMLAFDEGHWSDAAAEFKKAVARNPYDSQSWYYLAVCDVRMGDLKSPETILYYIWPGSAYFGVREYQLGRLAFLRHDNESAVKHLLGAINSNGEDLRARLLLAMVYGDQGKRDAALKQLAKVSKINPTNRLAQAQRYFLTGDKAAEKQLRDFMGEQSQDAIEVSIFYSSLDQWKQALAVLKMVEPPNNKDPWGTPPVYYYTLAYAEKQVGNSGAAAEYRKKARAAAGIVERFPYRRQTLAPLQDAVKEDPQDTVARLDLANLLYFLGDKSKAIEQWAAVNRIDPSNFSARRSLGLAYEADGKLNQAIPELEKATQLQPDSADTFDDLATAYARAGQFDKQLALLQSALKRSPGDDSLTQGVLKANLIEGNFKAAQAIVDNHTFKPIHRHYQLLDLYRQLEYGMGGEAFKKGDYQEALKRFQAALHPPTSLGVDDFSMNTPRIDYYIGRTYDAMGKPEQAKKAYESSIRGVEQLAGGGSESWSPDNFFMVFSLDRLGRQKQAAELVKEFQTVANSRAESESGERSARARYLNGLISLYKGDTEQARKHMKAALDVQPDDIGPMFELRGTTINPGKSAALNGGRAEIHPHQ
jgi:tetratricopeptide (TPR) repeat protein